MQQQRTWGCLRNGTQSLPAWPRSFTGLPRSLLHSNNYKDSCRSSLCVHAAGLDQEQSSSPNKKNGQQPEKPPAQNKNDITALQQQMLAMQQMLLEQQTRNAEMQQQMEALFTRLTPQTGSENTSPTQSTLPRNISLQTASTIPEILQAPLSQQPGAPNASAGSTTTDFPPAVTASSPAEPQALIPAQEHMQEPALDITGASVPLPPGSTEVQAAPASTSDAKAGADQTSPVAEAEIQAAPASTTEAAGHEEVELGPAETTSSHLSEPNPELAAAPLVASTPEASSPATPQALQEQTLPTTTEASVPRVPNHEHSKSRREGEQVSTSGRSSNNKSRSQAGSSSQDDAVLRLAQKLDELNTRNAQLVELLKSKDLEVPANLLQSMQPLAAQLERLRTEMDDASGALGSGRGSNRAQSGGAMGGRGRGRGTLRRGSKDSTEAAGSTSPRSTSSWQNIKSGVQHELPPPVDDPFVSLPRMSASRGAAAAAEATAGASEQAKPHGPLRPNQMARFQDAKNASANKPTPEGLQAASAKEQDLRQGQQAAARVRRPVSTVAERSGTRGRGGVARVPMSDVEQMLAAGRPGPPSFLMERIWSTSSWRDLQRMATMQQRSLDTHHTVAVLARLPTLAPSVPDSPQGKQSSKGCSDDARAASVWSSSKDAEEAAAIQAFAAELATLLQLQLSRLPPSALAAVVYSVGHLGAAPKPAWVETARAAAERAARRMDAFQWVAVAHGLASLQASPSPAWFSMFWGSTAGQLSCLSQLSLAASAVARFQRQGLLGERGSEVGGQKEATATAGGVSREWVWLLKTTAAATAAQAGIEPPQALVAEYQTWWEQQQAVKQQPALQHEQQAGGMVGGSSEGTGGNGSAAFADADAAKQPSEASPSSTGEGESGDHAAAFSAAAQTAPEQPISNSSGSKLSFEPSAQELSAPAVVGFVHACHNLGVAAELDQAWVLRLLMHVAAGRRPDGGTSSKQGGLQQCSARDLVSLGHVLAVLPTPPPAPLVDAFATAVWTKLNQVPPAVALPVFQQLAGWGYQMPGPMLHSFLAQVAPNTPSPSGSSGPSPLQSIPASMLCSFLVTLASYVSPKTSISLDYTRLEVLQDELAAHNMDALSPPDVVALLGALGDIQCARAAAAAAAAAGAGAMGGDGRGKAGRANKAALASPSAALPAFRGGLLSAAFRSVRQQLNKVEPATMASLCTTVAKSGAQMDVDLLEAYLAGISEPEHKSQLASAQGLKAAPSQLCALVTSLGEMAAHAQLHGITWRPRSSLLGPFMAKFVQELPACSSEELVRSMGALASMQLSREDLQGVRVTTASGIPSPTELCASLLAALHPHLPSLTMHQLAQLATSVALLGAAPSAEWAAVFVERCSQGVTGADVPDLVTLLAALPSATSSLMDDQKQAPVQAQGSVRSLTDACVSRIGAGVAELDLPALVDLMHAVSGSSGSSSVGGGMTAALMQGRGTGSESHAAFVGAVLEASEAKMGAADLPTLARLAAATAQAGAKPSPGWLNSLQSVTAPMLLSASETHAAELSWAVAKLATASAATAPSRGSALSSSSSSSSSSGNSSSSSSGGKGSGVPVLPQWRTAFEQRVAAQRPGVGEAYSLIELAQLLWASAALGVSPRAGLVNSFAGKSIDRMSSVPPQLVLESAWATAALGAQMTTRWLNQWTASVQGSTLAQLSPRDLEATLWALNFHFLGHLQPTVTPLASPAPSSNQPVSTSNPAADHGAPFSQGPLLVASPVAPPTSLLDALSARLTTFLSRGSIGQQALPYTPSHLVAMSTTLACFGYVPAPEASRIITDSLLSAIQQQQQQQQQGAGVAAVLTGGELVAAAWVPARFRSVPSPGYVPVCLACLQHANNLHRLSQLQVVRLLWSLASLGATAQVPPSLLDLCESLLPAVLDPGLGQPASSNSSSNSSSNNSRSSSASTGRVPPGDIVDALWALSMLGRPLALPRWQQCMGRLTNRISNLTPAQLSGLLAATASSGNTLSPALANEVSKVAASRFGSMAITQLSDLIYSFARLDLPLAPALASTAIKRLQTSLALLPAHSLAQTLWSFAAIGYAPMPPQLQAYQKQALAAVPGMSVSEAALVLDAFNQLNFKPSDKLLDAIEARTLPLMQQCVSGTTQALNPPASQPDTSSKMHTASSVDQSAWPESVNAATAAADGSQAQGAKVSEAALLNEALELQPPVTSGEMILVMLGLSRSGRTPGQGWLRAWFAMLRAESIALLDDKQVLAVLDLLAVNSFGMSPKPRWCAALLARLQPLLPCLESKPLQSLLAMLVQWEELGMGAKAAAQGSTAENTDALFTQLRDEVVRQVPARVADKLAAYNAPTVVEIMYDMWVLKAPMPKTLVQRMTEQVHLGLQLGLPNSVMVKLCSALSEHGAYVCSTGDGVLAGLAAAQKDILGREMEGLAEADLLSGGSPLQGLPLFDTWIIQDKVLSLIDLDSCEDQELVAIMISVQGMVSCLRSSKAVQSQAFEEELMLIPLAEAQALTASTPEALDNLSEPERNKAVEMASRYWQLQQGITGASFVLAVGANGEPWDASVYIEQSKRELQADLTPEQVDQLENDGLVVRRLWVRKFLATFKSKLRAGRMSCQALAQALPAMDSLQLPCIKDRDFIDGCLSYVTSRMEIEPPADLAHVAWALSIVRVVPEAQWIDRLLAALETQPGRQTGEAICLSPDAVADLAQALQAWGVEIVKPALSPPRWSALLAACTQGREQGLFSPTDATQLLGNLCALSKSQGKPLPLQPDPLPDEWIQEFAEAAVFQQGMGTSSELERKIEPQAIALLLRGLSTRGRGMPKQLLGRSEQLLDMVAVQQEVTPLETFTQVFVAVYQLGLRPSSSWLALMQQALQQQDNADPALKPARSWLNALERL